MFKNRFRCLFLNNSYKNLDKTIISASIPSVDIGVNILQAPPKNIFYPGDSLEFSDLSIEFQLEEDYANWKMIMNWIYDNKNFDTTISDQTFSDISLQLADMKKNIIYSVELIDCFPISISEINFDTRISEIEPIIFNVVFKINNLKFKEGA